MYRAVQQHEKHVKFREPVASETLDLLMMLLNYDCPELIHVKGDYSVNYTDNTETAVSTVFFYYNMSAQEYRTHEAELRQYFESLRTRVKGKSVPEQEQFVYDEIFRQCIYDESTGNAGSVYGALMEHHARCEGISKAFMWCMRELGIECLTVVGTPLWQTDAVYPSHSWNLVKLGDDWYHVDLTSDNLQSSEDSHYPALYGFLNTDDRYIYRSRVLSPVYASLGVPACTKDEWNYHVRSGLLVRDGDALPDSLNRIWEEHFEQGQYNELTVRFEGQEEYREMLKNWETWLDDYTAARQWGEYDSTIYYNGVSLTVCIRSRPLEVNE